MLRLRREPYVVTIGACSASLIRRKKTQVQGEVLACSPWSVAEVQSDPPLADALAQLLEQGTDIQRISVVLQDNTVAYATLPWVNPALGATELAELAEIRIEELYGVAASGRLIRLWQEYGRQGIVCAISKGVVEQIEQFADATGIRVDDVRPALSDLLVRSHIPKSSKEWLAVDATSEGCLFAAHDQAGWKSVRFVPYSNLPDTNLHNLVRRECLLLASDVTSPIYLSQADKVRRTSLDLLEEEAANG